MHNAVFLLGRIKSEISEDGLFDLSVNQVIGDKIEDTNNFIVKVKVKGSIADAMKEYTEIGDLLAIRGMLADEGNGLIIVVDKMSFLSNNKKKEEE